MAPALVVSEASAQEWQYSGWFKQSEADYSSTPDRNAPITVRDLKVYASVLGLDEMQMEIVYDAFAEFDQAFRREWVVFAEARDDLRYSYRHREELTYDEAKRTYTEAMDRIEAQFYADLRLMLSPEQLERWAKLERDRRRSKTISEYAVFDEERIDLVACVQALELSAEQTAALEPLLEQYREQLDAALVARNRKAETVGRRCLEVESMLVSDWSSVDRSNPAEIEAVYEAQRAARSPLVSLGLDLYRACGRVKEVNEQFIRRIEEALPAGLWEDFREVAASKSEEQIYADSSRASNMFGVLENLPLYIASRQMQIDMQGLAESERIAPYLRRLREVQPLTETQRDQIAQIRSDWEAERAAVEARYESVAKPAPKEEEPEPHYIQLLTPHGMLVLRREIEKDEQKRWDESDQEALAERDRKLNHADQRAIERLRQILTIEQRSLFVML